MISPDASVVADAANERDVDALVAANNALRREKQDLEVRVSVLVDDNDLAGHVITAFDEQFGPDVEQWENIIGRVVRDYEDEREDVIEFLRVLDVLPDELIYKSFDIQVSVPVYFTMHVQAIDSDHACELASDMVGSEWPQTLLDTYDWDMDTYSLSIDSVEEA